MQFTREKRVKSQISKHVEDWDKTEHQLMKVRRSSNILDSRPKFKVANPKSLISRQPEFTTRTATPITTLYASSLFSNNSRNQVFKT
jgi:hypothetical protein